MLKYLCIRIDIKLLLILVKIVNNFNDIYRKLFKLNRCNFMY